VAFCLALIFLGAGLGLGKVGNVGREFLAPLECGFRVNRDGREPVSLRFFIYAVIFVVFDIELVLVVPLLFKLPGTTGPIWFFFCLLRLLRAGLLFE